MAVHKPVNFCSKEIVWTAVLEIFEIMQTQAISSTEHLEQADCCWNISLFFFSFHYCQEVSFAKEKLCKTEKISEVVS